eukprot:7582026-Pyramimonas_sp.AAC.2
MEEFGDPKTNKAKVCTIKNKKGKAIKGVYVRVGRRGVYKVKSGVRNSSMRTKVHDDGEHVLDEEQLAEAEVEAEETLPMDDKSALTYDETKKRRQLAMDEDSQDGDGPET